MEDSLPEFEGAIGIDLGTTYSCVAVYLNGRVDIIPNQAGSRTTPSFIAFNATDKLTGDAARNQHSSNPKNTVYDAKRLIGRKFTDHEVQNDMKHWPFTIEGDANGDPLIMVEHKGEQAKFRPEQISGFLLEALKQSAEKHLGKKVKKAVITVPAYFNDAQRSTTKLAGKLAGLEVLRILNEPTAAALAYGLDGNRGEAKEKLVLIFDLGGGTFDVSIVRLEEQVYEVKATAGNTHLGGQDFDNNLVEYCVKEIQKKAGDSAVKNLRLLRKLKAGCEAVKKTLSTALQATMEIGLDEIDTMTITRTKFEQLNKDLFNQCLDEVKRVIVDAGTTKDRIDDIVMVGGSSRIPKIQQLVEEYFGKKLKHSIHPDEAIAHGAAIQANMIAGSKEDKEKVGDLLLLDVVPLSLGVDMDGGVMDILIKRNSTVPRAVTKEYTTPDDETTEVDVDVYEGERQHAKSNHMLGSFKLSGIRPGLPKILVTFAVDQDGVLNVSASEHGGTAKATINIQNTSRVTSTEVDQMIAEATKFRELDAIFAKLQTKRAAIENFVCQLLEYCEDEENKVEDSVTEKVRTTQDWLEENYQTATFDDLEEKFQEMRDINDELEDRALSQASRDRRGGKKRPRGSDDESDETDDYESDESESSDEDSSDHGKKGKKSRGIQDPEVAKYIASGGKSGKPPKEAKKKDKAAPKKKKMKAANDSKEAKPQRKTSKNASPNEKGIPAEPEKAKEDVLAGNNAEKSEEPTAVSAAIGGVQEENKPDLKSSATSEKAEKGKGPKDGKGKTKGEKKEKSVSGEKKEKPAASGEKKEKATKGEKKEKATKMEKAQSGKGEKDGEKITKGAKGRVAAKENEVTEGKDENVGTPDAGSNVNKPAAAEKRNEKPEKKAKSTKPEEAKRPSKTKPKADDVPSKPMDSVSVSPSKLEKSPTSDEDYMEVIPSGNLAEVKPSPKRSAQAAPEGAPPVKKPKTETTTQKKASATNKPPESKPAVPSQQTGVKNLGARRLGGLRPAGK